MKSLRLTAAKKLELTQSPPPVPGNDEVVLTVTHCALCRTDAKMFAAGQRDLELPRVPGHEFAGRDDKGVPYVVWPGCACAQCRPCLEGMENLCSQIKILGFNRDGGLSEQVAVPRQSLIPIPPELDSRVACMAELVACGLNALEQARVGLDDDVLIFGAGPAGLLTALAAWTIKARPTIAEINEDKLALSSEFRNLFKIPAQIRDIKGEFDAVINAAPSPETFATGLKLLRQGGRFCLFSGMTDNGPLPMALLNEVHYRQLTVTGAYGCTREQMTRAVSIIHQHASALEKIIERRIGLHQVSGALEEILEGKALKFVVDIS